MEDHEALLMGMVDSVAVIGPRSLKIAMSAFLVLLTGCQGYDDHDYSAAEALRLGPLPESAIPQGGFLDPYRVQFLLPNADWRNYVAAYYPVAGMSERVAERVGDYPMACTKAFRSGVKLVSHETGGEIRYLETDVMAFRLVSAMPNCEPGWTYIEWFLEDPFDPDE